MRSRDRLLTPCLVGLAACAVVDPEPDYAEARRRIQESTGRSESFDPEAPAMSEAEIEAVLAGGLTLDETLRLALLNNRRLQAGFARLGIARAELVQAGLLRNPSLGLAFLLPSGGGSPKITVDLAQSVVEIWELPARKRIAQEQLAQQVLEVSRFAGEIVADSTGAYFESVAARDLRASARESAELAQRQLDAVRQRVEGGVATESDASLARSAALSAELAFRRAEREGVTAKRLLAAHLSLIVDLQEVELTDTIPPPETVLPNRETVVARSLRRRLDVLAAKKAVEAASAQLELEERRVWPRVEATLSAERPEQGVEPGLLVGPGATVEIPVFDQNQAQVARAEYRRRELEGELQALSSEVAQGVRAAVDRADAASRTAVFLGRELLPQAERNLEVAGSAYELGGITLLILLESQRAVIEARQSLIEAVLEAARARVELERQAGGPMEENVTEGSAPGGGS